MSTSYDQFIQKSNKGIDLTLYHWSLADPKAVVVLTHGLAGYALRYEDLAVILQQGNIAVIGVDLTGHGHSKGLRGYIEDFQDYVDDYGMAIDFAQQQYPGLPLFAFGHSMGATVASHYILQNQSAFAGAVLMGIAMYVTDSVPKFLVFASRITSKILPTLPAAKLDSGLTSTDPEKVKAYQNDPLIYTGRVRARTGYTFMMHAEALKEKSKQLNIPLLILHGGKDGLCNPEGSRHLHRNAAHKDKIINIYPELYHEILNEAKGPEIIQDIRSWILNHSTT